ncbi:hypothetical protein AVEN_31058-1 [Araneus ventricosus]|uniref:Uncharacterized protein n=1 Tax=Araneus ventricosus TaxID=182803 RepID=A0A4Y2GFS4_ARAVE|nr:hypothetical protein AVEN_31058-1 [Araneus ventricosus]
MSRRYSNSLHTLSNISAVTLDTASVILTLSVSLSPTGSVLYVTPLKVRITDTVSSVTAEMLENTWRELEYRLHLLRATKSARIEIY